MDIAKAERVKRIHDIFMLLMRISKRWLAQRLQIYGLTFPQFVTLAALAVHQQACTMSDLTNVTFQDPPTTTGIIDRLVKMKLVQRTRSETDRRVVLVKSSEAGIELINQIEQSLMQDTLPGYDLLTDEELATVEQLLGRLLRIHLTQYMSIEQANLDAEIEKLEHFVKDPIYYQKLENEKNT